MYKVEVIGSRNSYKKYFPTLENALYYCRENQDYFNNALVYITNIETDKTFLFEY